MKPTDESMTTLIDACNVCIIMCYTNAAKCNEMKGMEACHHICINCAEACEMVIVEFGVNKKRLLTAVDQCAHISSMCAEECAKYDNNHCRECSEICLKCAELCSTILGQEQEKKAT